MDKSGSISNTQKSRSFSISERYTEHTRKALLFAEIEARSRGSAVITVSDLLSGLGMDENFRSARVGLLKQNAFYLRWLTGLSPLPAVAPSQDLDSILSGASLEPRLPLDESVKQAMICAVSEADRDREYWVDSDHLLRGLLCFDNSADFAFLKTELTLAMARTNSRRDREEFLPQENPNAKVIEYLLRKHLALWGPPIVSLACYLYILMQTIGFDIPTLAH